MKMRGFTRLKTGGATKMATYRLHMERAGRLFDLAERLASLGGACYALHFSVAETAIAADDAASAVLMGAD